MYRVLLAEDEEFILQGLKDIIDWEELGLEVIYMARDGEEAFELFQKDPVDIIVTDISMPTLDGLQLLKTIRHFDKRVRCILLSGYDEFEYARTAITLDVEQYILKPINEEQLIEVLKDSIQKLKNKDQESEKLIQENEEKFRFFQGEMAEPEVRAYLKKQEINMTKPFACLGLIWISHTYLESHTMSEIYDCFRINTMTQYKIFECSYREILIFIPVDVKDREAIYDYFQVLQNQMESQLGMFTFITVSQAFSDVLLIPQAYKEVKRLQKYLVIEGYGCIVDTKFIEERKTLDISINKGVLQRIILAKNKEEAISYIEDLFINNMKTEQMTYETIYQMGIKLAVILQEVADEFQLSKEKEIKGITELVKELYDAEELSAIKSIFLNEILELMDLLHVEDSQYTPVVRQVLSDIELDYKQETNLKQLAKKYNMNTSYLGQIFQKEVGCSFSNYLRNIKNSKARELILNTNMRINDIAKEVGYLDSSYFYKQFKQCYGVSPATLREMKKY